MKKFTLPKFPKLPQFGVIYKHFKKKPSRLAVWLSICAIIAALVITLVNPNSSNRAKAVGPGIDITNAQVTLRQGTTDLNLQPLQPCDFDNNIRACGYADVAGDGNLYWVYYNDYIIDVDGYLMIRYYPEDPQSNARRPYGFEYVYYHKPGDANRFQFTSSSDLVIEGSGTRVYMEGNKTRPLKLNSLAVKDSAVLSQVPANKDGITVPYSTNTAWGVQLFGYYYLGPQRQVKFKLFNNDKTLSNLLISTGQFTTINTPDSIWGKNNRYIPETTGQTYCSARDNDDLCQFGGADVIFQNPGANGIFLSIMLTINKPTDDKIISYFTQFENNIAQAIPAGDIKVPIKKIVAIKADGTPDATAGNDTFFPATGDSNIGMAYYVDSYGVLQNHDAMDSLYTTGFIYDAPRMFQDIKLSMEAPNLTNNDESILYYGIDTREDNINYGGQINLQAFYWIWEAAGFNVADVDVRKSNPISYSRYPHGEDYLRISYPKFITSKMIGEPVPGQPDIERQARINLELTGDLNISNNGQIDVSGKGYPGGITEDFNFKLPDNSLQFSAKQDSPIHGAGYGGGKGTWGPNDDNEQDSCSASFGGNGITANRTVLSRATDRYDSDIYCGQTYSGGQAITNPEELGSGGGYYNFRRNGEDEAAIGGSGGGAIHIKAARVITDATTKIQANGGNGITGILQECRLNNNPWNLVNFTCTSTNTTIETKGILGQVGVTSRLNNGNETSWIPNDSLTVYVTFAPATWGMYGNTPRWGNKVDETIEDNSIEGTAGSGGSIWLESVGNFNNLGVIEARGAQGAARLRVGNKSAYYSNYNTGSILKCTNDINSDCRGPASGGGRVSILYGNDPKPNSVVRAWGGGVDSAADQTNSQKDLDHAIGGEGSVVYLQAQQASVNVQNIDIKKSVHRIDPTDTPSCRTNPDSTEAWANHNDWVSVNIEVTNNTSKAQDGVIVKDELFRGAVNTNLCAADGNGGVINNNEISWTIPNGFVVGANAKKILRYYFQFDSTK